MDSLAARLEAVAGWRAVLAAAVVFAGCQVVTFGFIVPAIRASHPAAAEGLGIAMVDLHPFLSVEEAYRIFELYGPIRGWVRLGYAVDVVMPAALALLVSLLIALLLRALRGAGATGRGLVLVPFASLPFDYLENGLALFLTHRAPERFPALIEVLGVATALKFLFVAAGLGLLGVLGVTAARRR